MNIEPAKANPLARPCPFTELPLIWKGAGQAYCSHCRKDVHDLRGQSLVQVAQFMRTHQGACIMMGPAPQQDEAKG
jgi:hypothetical protein